MIPPGLDRSDTAPEIPASDPPLGAILAGGRARRLGGLDKAAIEVGGATLAERAAALLLPRCAEVIALTGPRPTFPATGIEVVPDRIPGRGPLGGLDAAFRHRPGRTILLLAVDLALLPAPILDEFLRRARQADPHAVASCLVPRTGDRLQPTCALYRPSLAAEVARRVAEGRQLALHHLTHRPDAVVVPLPARPADFAGVNTPADLERARRRGF